MIEDVNTLWVVVDNIIQAAMFFFFTLAYDEVAFDEVLCNLCSIDA